MDYLKESEQIECGLAWSVLLWTTSTRHHSGQNVATNFDHCNDAYRC